LDHVPYPLPYAAIELRSHVGILPGSIFCCSFRRRHLRTRQSHLSLCPEHIAIEIGYPLSPARGHIEIADGGLNLRRDMGPVGLWIFVDNVRGRIVAERLVQADLFKLAEQSIRLSHVVWIPELADEVRRAQQQSLFLV